MNTHMSVSNAALRGLSTIEQLGSESFSLKWLLDRIETLHPTVACQDNVVRTSERSFNICYGPVDQALLHDFAALIRRRPYCSISGGRFSHLFEKTTRRFIAHILPQNYLLWVVPNSAPASNYSLVVTDCKVGDWIAWTIEKAAIDAVKSSRIFGLGRSNGAHQAAIFHMESRLGPGSTMRVRFIGCIMVSVLYDLWTTCKSSYQAAPPLRHIEDRSSVHVQLKH